MVLLQGDDSSKHLTFLKTSGRKKKEIFLTSLHFFAIDMVVTSGLRFYYDTPRKYEAATLTTGASVTSALTIPPKQKNWISSGACMKVCSEVICRN